MTEMKITVSGEGLLKRMGNAGPTVLPGFDQANRRPLLGDGLFSMPVWHEAARHAKVLFHCTGRGQSLTYRPCQLNPLWRATGWAAKPTHASVMMLPSVPNQAIRLKANCHHLADRSSQRLFSIQYGMPDRRAIPPDGVLFICLTVFGLIACCHSPRAQRLLNHYADVDLPPHHTASSPNMDRQIRPPPYRPLQTWGRSSNDRYC